MPGKMGIHSGDPAIAAMCEVTGGNVNFESVKFYKHHNSVDIWFKRKISSLCLKEVIQETDRQIVILAGGRVTQYQGSCYSLKSLKSSGIYF